MTHDDNINDEKVLWLVPNDNDDFCSQYTSCVHGSLLLFDSIKLLLPIKKKKDIFLSEQQKANVDHTCYVLQPEPQT